MKKSLLASLGGPIALVSALLCGASSPAQDIQVVHPTNTVWTYNDSSISTDNPTLAIGGGGPRWMDPNYVPVIGNGQNQWKTGGLGLFGNDTSTVYTNYFGMAGNGFRTPLNRAVGGDSSGRYTFYFITKFNWPYTPSGVVLRGTNWLDDGGIVYLNGVEVFRARINGTAGTIPAWTDFAVNQGAEGVPEPLEYAATSLVTGENTLAVEVHQSSASSSDVAFTTALRAVLPASPTNTTPAEPSDRVVLQNRSTTLTVIGDGNPRPTYQWFHDNVAIPGATSNSYTIAYMQAADAGQYKVVLSNEFGVAVSRVAQVDYLPDGDKPIALRAIGSADNTTVTVEFDEELDPNSATDPFGWTVNGIGINQTPLLLVGGNAVLLTLDAPLAEDTLANVTVSSVKDLAGNEITATNFSFRSWVSTGAIGLTFDVFNNLSTTDNNLAQLTNNAKYPNNPDERYTLSVFNSRQVFPNDTKEGYGGRMRGLFIPPRSGKWRIYSYSDDSSNVYLNTNGPAAAGKTLVAYENGCCNPFQPAGPLVSQTSAALDLIGGQAYYVEAIYKEGTGGDYLQVGAKLDLDPTAPASLTPMPAAWIGSGRVPANVVGPVLIVQQPSSATVSENTPAVSFSVTGSNALGAVVFYQWQRSDDGGATFADVAGAIGPTYTLAFPTIAADNGDKYRCLVQVPGSALVSDEVTLTVFQDTTKPTVFAVHGSFQLDRVIVSFSEPVGASAEDTFAYSSSAFVVNSAVRDASHTNVILTLDVPLAVGSEHVLTIKDIMDNAGLVMDTTNVAVRAWVMSRGFALQQLYFDIGSGVAVTDFTGNPKYPNSPDAVDWIPTLDGPVNRYDAYGTRFTGWISPPIDGDYLFYACSDDGGNLLLSPNEDPAGLALIAQEMSWNDQRTWTGDRSGGTRGSPPSNISTNPIPLVAGQLYAFEMLGKEGGGGDNTGVSWQPPGQPVPANGTPGIAGGHLYCLADPVGASVTITQQPVSVEATFPATVSFTVGAESTLLGAPSANITYLWQRNNGSGFTDIIGAYGSTYSVTLSQAEADTPFRVLVFSPGASATSQVVTATSAIRVDITRNGNIVRISWPLPGTGITLETTPTLEGTPPPWTPVPPGTYQTDATSVYVEIVSPTGNAYYRLRQ